MIAKTLKFLFFLLIAKPISLLILGFSIRGKKHLIKKGPALLIANHNSHLDTLVLMSLFPIETIHKIRPVAAADYFFKNKALKWFSQNVIGIIPFNRGVKQNSSDPFEGVKKALNNSDIVIFFPEGTRGKPEQLSPIKSGIYRLMKDFPHVPIIPIYLSGLGKAFPKGDFVLVPFHVDINIGKKFFPSPNRLEFLNNVHTSLNELSPS